MPAPARREQVMSVAAKVFAEKGYRTTSVTDIVEGAHIGRGTFYLYFKSKRDVFLELVNKYFNGFAGLLQQNHKRLEKSIAAEEGFVSIWRDNMMRILNFHHENPDLTAVVYGEAMGRDEDFSSRLDKLTGLARKQMMEDFQMLRRNGLLRECDSEVAITQLLGAIILVLMEHVVKEETRDIEQLANEIAEYHFRALNSGGESMSDALQRMERKGIRVTTGSG